MHGARADEGGSSGILRRLPTPHDGAHDPFDDLHEWPAILSRLTRMLPFARAREDDCSFRAERLTVAVERLRQHHERAIEVPRQSRLGGDVTIKILKKVPNGEGLQVTGFIGMRYFVSSRPP